jgi:hypothetical protein
MSTSRSSDAPPPLSLIRLLFGAQATQLAYVMAKLQLADLLRDGARSTAELASATQTDAQALQRLLRGLTSLGLCTEVEPATFALTASGAYLRSDVPGSLHARAMLNGEVFFPLWGDLLQTVRTGQGAAARVLGAPFYQYLAEHPDMRAVFDRTMASAALSRLQPAVAAYDFSRFHTVVDVGGGTGALIEAILQRYPQPRGVVFDFPAVVERAEEYLRARDLAGRCSVVGGDAMASVPAGGDCYVLSNLLVGMDDARAGRVLSNCRTAMADSGTLLLVEWVMSTGRSDAAAGDDDVIWDTANQDLLMLSHGGIQAGRVRTEGEFRGLLEAAGFSLTAILTTSSSVKVLEAAPTN